MDVRFRVSGKVEICPKAWRGHMVNAFFLASVCESLVDPGGFRGECDAGGGLCLAIGPAEALECRACVACLFFWHAEVNNFFFTLGEVYAAVDLLFASSVPK